MPISFNEDGAMPMLGNKFSAVGRVAKERGRERAHHLPSILPAIHIEGLEVKLTWT